MNLWFKGTRVSKSSDLGKALENKDMKAAEKIHEEAMKEFNKTYPQCNEEWFRKMNRQ